MNAVGAPPDDEIVFENMEDLFANILGDGDDAAGDKNEPVALSDDEVIENMDDLFANVFGDDAVGPPVKKRKEDAPAAPTVSARGENTKLWLRIKATAEESLKLCQDLSVH